MEMKNRILKLRQMMEGGTENEKKLAKSLYEKLISKYDIDEKSITEQREFHVFKVSNEIEGKLIKQVHSMVTNITTYRVYNDRRKRNYIKMECTDEEYEIITLYFELYKSALKREIDSFVTAFIVKNNIMDNNKYEDDGNEESTFSLEERRKIHQYCMGIDSVQLPYRYLEK